MKVMELWVDRKNYRQTKVVERETTELADGEILVAIDKFALTANNVSYAVSGDMIGYWQFFPAEDDWGKVPVWGMADVIESKCADVTVGERMYGFFPMASHIVMTPGHVSEGTFVDVTAHRQSLPGLYNQYQRTAVEPDFLGEMEDERCVLFPLFMTAFVINDYLEDNDFFGASQILVGSVSSKTGLGLAALLHQGTAFDGKLVGLTSAGNESFMENLGICDQLVIYGDEGAIDPGKPTVYVDMSGNGPLKRKLHELLQDNMVFSSSVGATHWEEERTGGELPGAKPEFFFAPGQIAKRNDDWGPGVLFERANVSNAKLAEKVKGQIVMEHINGGEPLSKIWVDMLDNNVSPKRGIMASMKS